MEWGCARESESKKVVYVMLVESRDWEQPNRKIYKMARKESKLAVRLVNHLLNAYM